jgi:hypothetical protein
MVGKDLTATCTLKKHKSCYENKNKHEMLTLKRTNSNNDDFQKLIHELDRELVELDNIAHAYCK